MEPIVQVVQTVGTYVYQVGQAVVVGTSNVVVEAGSGVVNVFKAIFQGIGLG